jgi:hypothetical protein
MNSLDKVYITENIINKEDLLQIVTHLKNTPVTFDETGYSPYGVYAGGGSPTLPYVLDKYYNILM